MTLMYVPPANHSCGPNGYGFWLNHSFDRVGTVRGCECGKTWVAYEDSRDPGYMGVKWHREGRLARRRRLKRANA